MIKWLLLLFVLFPHTSIASKPMRSVFDHSHKLWSQELGKHVTTKASTSTVNYKAWKNQQAPLDKYLNHLSGISNRQFGAWSKSQQQAFLINAYNAFTVKLILKNYPVPSIKKIGGWFTKPWSIKFIPLLGKTISLDAIEHDMLRKNYSEPRVHFAVNCASIGCPMLLNTAYIADNLNQQLETQTLLFLSDSTRNHLNIKKKSITVSKIFSWFKEDFESNGSTVHSFVWKYMSKDPLPQTPWSINYSHYDWDLNE